MSTENSNQKDTSNELYTLLCAGFPAVGKSHFYNHSKLKVLDSDSSKFDKAFFPQNYIDHIKANLGKVLLEHNLVAKRILDKAINFEKKYDIDMLKFLFVNREINENKLTECLADEFKIPYFPLGIFKGNGE